ncbi:zinc finger, PHD-type containing protein [Tanacetum coccineum]
MTWHATVKCTEPGLAADGFNLFGNLSQSYNMWPVILTTYIQPSWPLIDDLKDLWAKPGVETIDVATSKKFNMRAMVLWTINDFPARSSLSGWSGQGYKACPTCNEDTPSMHGVLPRKFDRDDIMAQLARLPMRVKDVMHIEKNVLESILNTLLMNEKSKDTTKARQELKRLCIRSGLWFTQNKNEKCTKPQAAYSFTLGDRKKFCQFIKGVKLPDGFESNFKPKVTDNDTNITGLKSHDCHIMMQRLLPYGLQQYLPADVAKPIIELCLFFKQICSSKVVDILCNLELIYPPGFFDIMIHLVIHLPLEALEGGPIHPRWMYPHYF